MERRRVHSWAFVLLFVLFQVPSALTAYEGEGSTAVPSRQLSHYSYSQTEDSGAKCFKCSNGVNIHPRAHPNSPMLQLNETEVLRQHGPTPLSYYDLDSGVAKELYERYGSHFSSMKVHVVFMVVAFIIALPMALYLRAAKHTYLAGLAQIVFLVSLSVGMLFGAKYSRSTPHLYKGQLHSSIGWIAFYIALGLSFMQILGKGFALLRRRNQDSGYKNLVQRILIPCYKSQGTGYGFVRQSEDCGDLQENPARTADPVEKEPRSHQYPPASDYHSGGWEHPYSHEQSPQIRNQTDSCSGPASFSRRTTCASAPNSDDTLNEEHFSPRILSSPISHASQQDPALASWETEPSFADRPIQDRTNIFKEVIKYVEIFIWRCLIPLSWVSLLSGITVYSGGCRGGYGIACIAHTIKGSIFFWYGLITFSRYCGAWAELGWAWNNKPYAGTWRDRFPSAEMVECFVIWLYGATNTWMERFGAQPGDPYTVKQVQHISIAVMYFFAGGAGMMLESKTIRLWLSNAILERVDLDKATAPSSYSGSFNIFPAICIGVTGIAMSAHHQDYVFSVTVHALWGILLAGFSVFRIMTYTFLYLRPPSSILPSRPPTEALAAFCLAAGGIVFILSTEEVIYWAMRHGADDIMAFLNVTVAFVCFVFAWMLALMALKGWATKRSRVSSRIVPSLHAPRNAITKPEGTV